MGKRYPFIRSKELFDKGRFQIIEDKMDVYDDEK